MTDMDMGERLREYRESVAVLRLHAPEATAAVSGLLLDEPGSIRKWQATYMVGEFGDQSALALLRRFVNLPLPQSLAARGDEHETDLVYDYEVASRFQALMSARRIAGNHTELREEVTAQLVAIAHEVPLLKGAAMSELRRLLGPDFQMLRAYFGAEDAYRFERFMPPPEWQARLRQRAQR
jgi:hypothetical protein